MRRHRKLVGLLVAGGLIASMAATASADDFTTDNSGVVTATKTVNVSLTAVGAEGPWDKNADGCNIGNVNDSHTVTASITSSDSHVATVNPASMTFDTCGVSQPLTVTVLQQTCTKTATITIAKASVSPGANAVKGMFSTETLSVQSLGSAPTDPSCTTTTGGSSLCSEPAAPAWAAAFLKRSGFKANSTTTKNIISAVAHHMGPQTDFEGVPKSATGPDTVAGDYAYAKAVHDWMQTQFNLNLASVADTLTIRPGFECTAISA